MSCCVSSCCTRDNDEKLDYFGTQIYGFQELVGDVSKGVIYYQHQKVQKIIAFDAPPFFVQKNNFSKKVVFVYKCFLMCALF